MESTKYKFPIHSNLSVERVKEILATPAFGTAAGQALEHAATWECTIVNFTIDEVGIIARTFSGDRIRVRF